MKKRQQVKIRPKRRNAPKVAISRRSSVSGKDEKIALLTRERDEALEQQKATAEGLSVIASSPGELELVFKAMLENATRLCEARYGTMWLRDGDAFRAAALHGPLPPAYIHLLRSGTL